MKSTTAIETMYVTHSTAENSKDATHIECSVDEPATTGVEGVTLHESKGSEHALKGGEDVASQNKMPAKRNAYRPDIDGLRALAVTGVCASPNVAESCYPRAEPSIPMASAWFDVHRSTCPSSSNSTKQIISSLTYELMVATRAGSHISH